jgi:hypothetical protein
MSGLTQRRQALFGNVVRPNSGLLSLRSHRWLCLEHARGRPSHQLFRRARSTSVECGWKLTFAKDDGWLVVIVTHLGIAGG